MVHSLMRKSDTSWSEGGIATVSKDESENRPVYDNLEIREDVPKPPSEQFFNNFKSVFNHQQEEELVNYIKKMNEIFFGLSKEDICSIAYKFAQNKRMGLPFENENVEDRWYANFVAQHPEVISKSLEKIVSNESPKDQFFHKLKVILKKHKFPLSHVYTVGELCIGRTDKKIPRIVSAERARQSLSSSYIENEEFITTVFCCSAIGNFVPPAVILPKKSKSKLLCDSICFKSAHGCNTSGIFLDWLKFFIETIRPSENKKVLLILENHSWYKSTQIFDYAAISNVILFSLPKPCCTELHPLYLSVFETFKQNFHDIIEKWSENHELENLSFNLNQIFLEAYLKSVKLQNAISGFEKAGILECHRDVSAEIDCSSENIDQSDGSSFLEANFALIKREKFNFLWNDLQKKAEARRTRKVKLPFMPYPLRNRKYKMKNSSKKHNVTFKSCIQTRRGNLSRVNVNNFDLPKSKRRNEKKTENDESVIQVVYELEIDF
ncbi:uncharacterized protein LOC135831768 [Planococcus citri]|uniref:uncharacterized protein LOC135831768 n=1 Tax=Planococcus citri TaxID=170843 RepID=UPI0031FA2BFF